MIFLKFFSVADVAFVSITTLSHIKVTLSRLVSNFLRVSWHDRGCAFSVNLLVKNKNNYTIKKLSLTIISERVNIWLIYYYTIFALLHYLDYLG